MSITKNIAKLFAVAVVALVAFGMTFAFAGAVSQATIDKYLADGFTAQWIMDNVDDSTESSSASCDMVYGLPGTMGIQNAVNHIGAAGTPISVDGAYGPATRAAVAAAQTVLGVSADGAWGPMTNAAYVAWATDNCSDEEEEEGPSGVGTDDGEIKNFDEISADENNVEEGMDEAEILAFDFEVEGDVLIDRVDFYLDTTAAGSESENSDDYFSEAHLMVDGDVVASEDESDWDEDSYGEVSVVTGDSDEYRIRFSGLDLVFADGDEPAFGLALSANNTIDTSDQSETWGAALATDSIRYTDGRGFSSSTGSSIEEAFGIDSEETAELSITTSSDDPDATVVEVDDENTTENATVFVFEIEEKNDVDATINDLTLTLTTGTEAEEDVVESVAIYQGSDMLGDENVSAAAVAFENLGLDIGGDATEEITVKVTLKELDGVNYNEGETLSVAFTSIDEAEDDNGNDEGDMSISGTPSSETHELRTEGVRVTFVDSSNEKTTDTGINDIVEFTLVFEVEAFGNDAFVDASCAVGSTGADVDAVEVDDATGTLTPTCAGDVVSSADEGTDSFEVLEDETESFEVNVLFDGENGAVNTSSSVRAAIYGIGYVMGADNDTAGDTVYSLDLSDYKSSTVTIYDRTA